jgi:hypothetical protein
MNTLSFGSPNNQAAATKRTSASLQYDGNSLAVAIPRRPVAAQIKSLSLRARHLIMPARFGPGYFYVIV